MRRLPADAPINMTPTYQAALGSRASASNAAPTVHAGIRRDPLVASEPASKSNVGHYLLPGQRRSPRPGTLPPLTHASAIQGSVAGRAAGKQVEADPTTVVFLDVDGVLHPLRGNDLFVERCVQALEQIVLESNATIILSSAWRLNPRAATTVNTFLKRRGLSGIADKTPNLNPPGCFYVPREEEIIDWLRRHPEVEHWVAIDDMDLASVQSSHVKLMQAHFVKTNSNTGLSTQLHVEKARRLLQNPRGSIPAPPSVLERSRGPAAPDVVTAGRARARHTHTRAVENQTAPPHVQGYFELSRVTSHRPSAALR